MGIRGANQETGQSYNRALVLKALQHAGQCSRVELANKTGLKQATISHIVSDFIAWGLVEETGTFSGNKGRRTIGLRLSKQKYRVIGFRLTRQHYTVGVFSLDCAETAPRVVVNIEDASPVHILREVSDTINRIIRETPDCAFLAVGVSVPGPYYKDSGEIALISDFAGWRNIPINAILQQRIAIPVVVEHDAKAGALAESILADGRDMFSSIVYVAAGQGIGAGIIHDGRIYDGALGIAGEIGHTCVDLRGVPCECGRRGCLTQYATTMALTRNLQRRLNDPRLAFADVVRLLRLGRPEALAALEETMEYLGAGIINLVYSYNPSCIVIGDELSVIGQPILDALNRQLRALNVTRLVQHVRLELAKLGNDSAYIGAAIVSAQYVFENIAALFDREMRTAAPVPQAIIN